MTAPYVTNGFNLFEISMTNNTEKIQSKQLQGNGLIPQEAIDEFKQIYLEEYGIELTDAQSTDKASKVLSLVKLLSRTPIA